MGTLTSNCIYQTEEKEELSRLKDNVLTDIVLVDMRDPNAD
jgi:hypothetical protein